MRFYYILHKRTPIITAAFQTTNQDQGALWEFVSSVWMKRVSRIEFYARIIPNQVSGFISFWWTWLKDLHAAGWSEKRAVEIYNKKFEIAKRKLAESR